MVPDLPIMSAEEPKKIEIHFRHCFANGIFVHSIPVLVNQFKPGTTVYIHSQKTADRGCS